MNIGIDIRCLMNGNRTGVGEYTYELLNACLAESRRAVFSIDKQNQYFLFYNSWQDVAKNVLLWKQDNVHYVYTRWPNKLLNLLLWLKIVRLDKYIISKFQNFKISKFDVWFSPNLNFTNLSKNIKYILTIHDLSFEFFPECFTLKQRLWHKFLNPRKQCQRADAILTPSESTKNDVANKYGVDEKKIKVLLSGLSHKFEATSQKESDEVRRKYNLPEKFILFLGTLEPRKNIGSIIQAYQLPAYRQGRQATRLPAGQASHKLIIAGALGWKNKKILKSISQTPGAQYIGYVDGADKPALYISASLFIYPSLYEGFGFPVLEAMAMGVPVITSNRSSLPEVAGNAGYLVNPHNVSEIANGMRLILLDEKLRDMMIEKGRIQAEKFRWKETAKIFLSLLTRPS